MGLLDFYRNRNDKSNSSQTGYRQAEIDSKNKVRFATEYSFILKYRVSTEHVTFIFLWVMLLSCVPKDYKTKSLNDINKNVDSVVPAIPTKSDLDILKNRRRFDDGIIGVKIGNQIWMIENLNVDTFRNGDKIQNAQSDTQWNLNGRKGIPSWCVYNNDYANTRYGNIYNWYAVNDKRGLAPKGWHIPSDTEWDDLIKHIGGNDIAGNKLKSATGWFNRGNGTNEVDFNGEPGGQRTMEYSFRYLGYYGLWWTSFGSDNNPIVCHYILDFNNGKVRANYYGNKSNGYYVRCIRD
jgi:uncharacterized protein (TIGR02145 family)